MELKIRSGKYKVKRLKRTASIKWKYNKLKYDYLSQIRWKAKVKIILKNVKFNQYIGTIKPSWW